MLTEGLINGRRLGGLREEVNMRMYISTKEGNYLKKAILQKEASSLESGCCLTISVDGFAEEGE